MLKYVVYSRDGYKPIKSFHSRENAVFWCKVNQKSAFPNGQWEDDYMIVIDSSEMTDARN